MIRELFKTDQPTYVSIDHNGFVINDQLHQLLEVRIQDIIPVRKFFQDRKLACYSLNNTTGKNGQYCALCRNRYRCRRRIRLMTLMLNGGPDPVPAIIEISPASFDALDSLLDRVDAAQLPHTLVTIRIRISDTVSNSRVLEFVPVF